MNRTLGLFLVVMPCVVSFQTAGSQTTVQAGISNEPPGSNLLVVRVKPSAALSGVFSGVNVTFRWLTSYAVTLNLVSTGDSIAPQGGLGTDGVYSYQTYGSIPNGTINWAAGSENELFRVRVDGNTGVGTFSLTNSPPGTTDWHFEFGGADATNYSTPFYQQSVSGVALPMHLSSFTATALEGSSVKLQWKTLSEIDNLGFEVQRSLEAAGPFESIAGSFIEGHGTTVDPQEYSYTIANTDGKNWYYRLKQMDRSGSVNYSYAAQASITSGIQEQATPKIYSLEQNYPNPFNPSTMIRYSLPHRSRVVLTVYNTLGQQLATLLNGDIDAGYHEVRFDASGLASGVYFYRLQAGDFGQTRKLLLLR